MMFSQPSGSPQRLHVEPQCTHLSMTRLYDPQAVCRNCRQPGPFGWVYQCTQDLEDLIEHVAIQGHLVKHPPAKKDHATD